MVECWAGNDAEEYKQGLERTLALPDIGGIAVIFIQFHRGFDEFADGGGGGQICWSWSRAVMRVNYSAEWRVYI